MTRPSVIPAAVLLLAACSDAPMAPADANKAPVSIASLEVSSTGATVASLDFHADLDIIADRVLPNFSDQEAADKLRTHLSALMSSLDAGDVAEATQVLGLARADLTASATNRTDAGYVEMVFDNIEQKLQ